MTSKETKRAGGREEMASPPRGTERSPTGIADLDEILQGGVPVGNTVLLAGTCGTGKTTACFEILCRGAAAGEVGVLFSTLEATDRSIANARNYEFFDESWVKDGKLLVRDLGDLYKDLGIAHPDTGLSVEDGNKLIHAIAKVVDDHKVKRLAIDSLTSICGHLEKRERIRTFMREFSRVFAPRGVTSYLVSEISPGESRYSSYGIEDVLTDGVILFSNLETRGDLLRTVQVIKMRGTAHSRGRYVMDLTPYGLVLVPVLKSYSMGGSE
jgi:circadian clock protein KaiC